MIVCFHRNKQTVNKYKLKFERKFSKKSHFYYMGDMFMTGSLGSQLDFRENEFFELKGKNSMPETFLLIAFSTSRCLKVLNIFEIRKQKIKVN